MPAGFASSNRLQLRRGWADLWQMPLSALSHRLYAMRPVTKVGLVLGGYLAAVLIACVVVASYVAATDGQDRQNSSGMYAFGDGLLFLAVLGVAAVPATSIMLFFLRPYHTFWIALSVVSLVIAVTGLAAAIDYVAARHASAGSLLATWSALAVLRNLVAPLFALGFLLSGVIAPNRFSRNALLMATVIEAADFACFALILFHSNRAG